MKSNEPAVRHEKNCRGSDFMLQVGAFANLVCEPRFLTSTRRSAATLSNERTTEYRVWCRLRTASETFLPPAEPPLLCPCRPAPPPAASPMITRRSEDKFSLIRKRRIKLHMHPSMTNRAQKLQAKEKRKDKNCRRRPLTSSVPFLCTALPSAAVGKCAHQYTLNTEVCRHLAEKTDAIKPRHSKWRFWGAPVTTLVNTRTTQNHNPLTNSCNVC